MHSNFPPSQLDKSACNRLHRSPCLKPSGSHGTPVNLESSAARRPDGLPCELDQYLTTADKPHEIFASLQDSHSRRLRLLLRRFTNQIQYGCKNSYCDVPTCLSYRKRHATTPIRPYSDVTTRALAWRCVEEYADAGKELKQSKSVVTTKKKIKAKDLVHNTPSGLCWNEPVIPWYQDPTEVSYRNDVLTAKRTSRRDVVLSGRTAQARSDVKLDDDQTNLRTNESIIRLNGTAKMPNDPRLKTEKDGLKTTPLSEVERHQSSTSSSSEDNKPTISDHGTNIERNVVFAKLPDEQANSNQPQVKDTASFTQTLYDTSSIKKLDHIKPSSSSAQDFDPAPITTVGSPETRSIDTSSEQQPANASNSHVRSTSTIPCVFTFKILPLSAILWLRSAMPYDIHHSPQRDLSTTPDHGEYSLFARQSLHLCLSSPLTLLTSAKTWRFVHRQPYRMEDNKRRQTITELASRERPMLESSKVIGLPQPGGVMVAFGMLIAITSIPEVLNHLFAALQHAYLLPHWLKRMSNKDAASSRNQQVSGVESSGSWRETHQAKDSPPVNDPFSGVSYGSNPLEDSQVAELCMLIMLALQLILGLKPQALSLSHATASKKFGEQYSLGRKSGFVFPYASLFKAWSKDPNARPNYQAYTARLDIMDDWSFQRLLDSLADVISHRLAIAETAKMNKSVLTDNEQSKTVIDMFISEILAATKVPDPVIHKQSLQLNLIDLLRSVVLRRWNRKAIIQRRGPVSGALELLAAIYRSKVDLEISPTEFQWAFVADAFNEVEMPLGWLDFREDSTQTHILSYSFLFEPANLVTYFRAINSAAMKRSHESASVVFADARHFLHTMPFTIYGVKEVLAEIRPNMAKFFVLTIRRDNMLQDAMNQLWRRQRQELTRPLKVRLGQDEGEDGLDHGGVQAEFFRLVFAEALDPSYGMFIVDERTRMTWFQPGSLEPLYKFEALGILMSLAVYNGITLPVTFPVAFYRKLLGLKVKTLAQIKDGWPELAKGLQQLLDWGDGDVGQIISRTYEFSYEAFGASFTVDMTKVSRDDPWPPVEHGKSKDKSKTASFEFPHNTSPTPWSEGGIDSSSVSSTSPLEAPGQSTPLSLSSSTPSLLESISATIDIEAPLVTNANRERYVKDYIYWLTNKSISPQFASFATGFHTCLNRTALSIFTPEHLKTVIEGHQYIDIDGLQSTATYDDYKSTETVIQWFWQVVRDMSSEQHKKLLEFVTASDRVPVNGIDSVVFIIQRNGDGDERLPSSSTCYGRLLLPRYSSKEVLREKLEKAVENSIGFGSL